MGNPHAVTFVDEAATTGYSTSARRSKSAEAFLRKINAEFIQVLSPTETRMRVWERGSRNTGSRYWSRAAVAAGVLAGVNERRVTVHLRGGDLEIEWAESGDVYMTGPATEVLREECRPDREPIMASPLTAEQVAQFHTDGYLFIEGLLDADETRLLQEACRADAVMQKHAMAVRDAEGL